MELNKPERLTESMRTELKGIYLGDVKFILNIENDLEREERWEIFKKGVCFTLAKRGVITTKTKRESVIDYLEDLKFSANNLEVAEVNYYDQLKQIIETKDVIDNEIAALLIKYKKYPDVKEELRNDTLSIVLNVVEEFKVFYPLTKREMMDIGAITLYEEIDNITSSKYAIESLTVSIRNAIYKAIETKMKRCNISIKEIQYRYDNMISDENHIKYAEPESTTWHPRVKVLSLDDMPYEEK